MLLLSPVLILILSALILLVIRLVRPNFGYAWLIISFITVCVWGLILVLWINLPLDSQLISWEPKALFPETIRINLDVVGWSLAFAISTILLGTILTDTLRISILGPSPSDTTMWAIDLSLCAIGLVVVLAGNLLTVILAWAALDIIGLILLVGNRKSIEDSEQIVVAYALRFLSIGLIIWGGISNLAGDKGTAASFDYTIGNIFFFSSVILRLIALILTRSEYLSRPINRGQWTLFNLIQVAACIPLLLRIGPPDLALREVVFVTVAVSLLAIFSAFAFVSLHKDPAASLPYFITGLSTLIVIAALSGQKQLSLSMSVAVLLSCGFYSLNSTRYKPIRVLVAFAWLGFTTLPFLHSINGGSVNSQLPGYGSPGIWLFLLIISLLIFSFTFLSHGFSSDEKPSGIDRWVRIIYPWGLALIVISEYLINWLVLSGRYPSSISQVLAALLIPLLTLLIIATTTYIFRRKFTTPNWIVRLYSLQWLFTFLIEVNVGVTRLIGFTDRILEGEGGILWTVLFLTLVFSLILQLSR